MWFMIIVWWMLIGMVSGCSILYLIPKMLAYTDKYELSDDVEQSQRRLATQLSFILNSPSLLACVYFVCGLSGIVATLCLLKMVAVFVWVFILPPHNHLRLREDV